jgi:hypothetical protein
VTDNVGNHPNAFLNSSVEYIKSVEKKKKSQTGVASGAPEQAQPPVQTSGDTEMSNN